MKRKHKRLIFVAGGVAALGLAAGLIFSALDQDLVFFFSPTDLEAKAPRADQLIRVGGLVEEGSVAKEADGLTMRFRVTDLSQTVAVSYKGIPPDLFREGQGVVVAGRLRADGVFEASEVLAKHDENYMPREVAAALKKSGQWKGADGQPPSDAPKPVETNQ